MNRDKIEAFYDDPIKTACDAWSTAKAYHLRSLSIDHGLPWRAQRWARFLVRLGVGFANEANRLIGGQPQPGHGELA
jgi:hypothetical protein